MGSCLHHCFFVYHIVWKFYNSCTYIEHWLMLLIIGGYLAPDLAPELLSSSAFKGAMKSNA